MIKSLSDAERRQAIGKAARKTFEEKLAFNIFIEKIEKVYRTVLKNLEP